MYHFSPGSSAPRPSWMVSKTDHNRPTPLFSFTKMKNKCQYIYISVYVFTVIQIVLPIRIYIYMFTATSAHVRVFPNTFQMFFYN